MRAPSRQPRRSTRRQSGQGLTEYIIIVFLVAVGTIGVVGIFGDDIRALLGASGEALAGSEEVANGATPPPPGALNWRMSGGGLRGWNSGGVLNRPNPGGSSNYRGGNPGGTLNAPAD
jgi:hypothetical protein